VEGNGPGGYIFVRGFSEYLGEIDAIRGRL
ncbi:MAG: hypothetical protein ACI8RD_002495, partial [Bacillariaceae sp.]|jgi:hypothetical protein